MHDLSIYDSLREITLPSAKLKNPWQRSFKSLEKLHSILIAAKNLYIENERPLSMRELAKRLHIGVSNLYRYVENKRELFFATIAIEFAKLVKKLDEIKNNHKGSALDLLSSIVQYIITFSNNDFSLFFLLFLMKPPHSSKAIGPFETYQDPQFSKFLFNILKKTIIEEKLHIPNPYFFANKTWGLILGNCTMHSPIYDYYQSVDPLQVNRSEYFKYLIASIREEILLYK